MPRKQNGFGKVKSFANFSSNRIDKGKSPGAFGSYPSNRRYGSTVTRSAVEQYNLDSTWSRWRKGMEYYYQAAYLEFQETDAVLFQGTEVEIPVTFSGYRFATKNADSNTHYAIQRTIDDNIILGYVQEIYNDQLRYPDNYANQEIWVKTIAGRNLMSDITLLRAQGERVGSGTTAANIKYVLKTDGKPTLYTGKSFPDGVTVRSTVPLNEILQSEFVQEEGVQALVGKVVYQPDLYTLRPKTLFDQFVDDTNSFSVRTNEINGGVRISILDSNTNLPPTLGDIESLTAIYKTENGTSRLTGDFFFRKSDYQRFFGKQYLTADVVRNEVAELAYAIMPYTILGVKEDPSTGLLELTSVPFQATLSMFVPPAQDRIIVFSDNSFTTMEDDYDSDGNYKHAALAPGEKPWRRLNLDVNPWQDQTFSAGETLLFADLYTCSCPAYLHAKIRSPETKDEEGNLVNRQSRAPAPTAKGASTYDGAGINKVSSIIESWATEQYKRGFKVCKHTIASMFINKIRVMEPNTFPTFEAREAFEEKLTKEIEEVAQEFNDQLKRSEITTVEIVYALAEALNLDDVELGYVMQSAAF